MGKFDQVTYMWGKVALLGWARHDLPMHQPFTYDVLLGDHWSWEDMRARPRRDLGAAALAELIEHLCRELAR